MLNIWNLVLYQPILNALIFLYGVLFQNLGLAIIALTIIMRLALSPLMNPQLKSASKMKELAPELEKLKKKHKDDKQKFMQAQLALYKEHGVNPAAGCLPQILQIIILITLYQVLNKVIIGSGSIENIAKDLWPFNQLADGTTGLNLNFLYLNLGKPDIIRIPGLPFGIPGLPGLFVIMATVFQFLSSKMMLPTVKKEEKLAEKTPGKTDDMAASMQKQMMYMFPAMTLIFGYTLQSGVMLYWFIFSAFSLLQQKLVNKNKDKSNLLKITDGSDKN